MISIDRIGSNGAGIHLYTCAESWKSNGSSRVRHPAWTVKAVIMSSSNSAYVDERSVCFFFFVFLFLSSVFFLLMFCTSRSASFILVAAARTHMLDRSSWQEEEPRCVLGLHRVSMVIWVLKLLLLPIDGCWYLVSELMYLCRCHLRHFLLISPWTCKRSNQ